jgi:hypothetical protein
MPRTLHLVGTALGVALALSAPAVAHADPRPTHPATSDTASVRSDGARKDHKAPATPAKKKPAAKARPNGTPSSTPESRQYVPDQPWETEFFVDNYVPGAHLARGPRVTLAAMRAP